MALTKQPVSLNFAQGINTKVDPFQLPIGQFLSMQNSQFDKAGQLTKRNGFKQISTLPNTSQTTLTTLNDNLIATGSNLYAYSSDTDQWLNQGTVQPVRLEVQALVRNSTAQTSPDAAVTPEGLACLVYEDSSGIACYQVSNSVTGQQVVPRVSLGTDSSQPRVFILGQYFIVVYLQPVGANLHLKYIAIPTATPASPKPAVDLGTGLRANPGYDAVVANDTLYVGWANAANQLQVVVLTRTLLISAPTSINSHTANLMSFTADNSGSTAVIWITWWDSTSQDGYSAAYNQSMLPVCPPTQVITNTAVKTLTSAVKDNINNIIFEVNNTYGAGPNAATQTDYVALCTIEQDATITAPAVVLRSVGLASKPILDNNVLYTLVAYGEQNQPTYFLIDFDGNIYMRLAYSNGGGYASTQVLPSMSLVDGAYLVPYLIKDFLTTINKGTDINGPSTAIYTQTGINLAKMSINTDGQYSSEIANALHLTGGMMWEYDGVKPVELGFHVWPENIGATQTNVGGLSKQQYFYQFTYEWTDNQGNLHRSAPSIPLEFDVTDVNPVAQSFTGTGTSGSNIVVVSSNAGQNRGQSIIDVTTPSAIPSNTTIEHVGTGVTATFTTSSATLTVTDTTGLYIGQLVTGFTNVNAFNASTFITGITGLTVNLSDNPLANGTSEVVVCSGGPTPTITLSNALASSITGDTLHTTNVATTASFSANSTTLTVNQTTGFFVGQRITDLTTPSNLIAGTVITAINGLTITISIPTVGAATRDSIVTSDILSAEIVVPTLRLTYKTEPNPVRIVGYRWSVAQQSYYQFTSVTSPIINDPSVDYVTIVDTAPDSQILGNALIYTTGGVVENIAPPASTDSALFNNRLWLIDAEDRNLLWFSKQVIEATPVEMSDLLTIYVAPTSGAQGSTGPMTALSAMDDKLIIFKKDAIYYINGIGPDNTGNNSGYSDPVFIGSTVGCTNPQSIVLTPNGLMFQSDKGIWLLGRDLQTQYIGAAVEAYNDQIIVGSESIPGTNQVRFVLTSNTTLVYDYFYNQWGTFSNLFAISSTLYQGSQTYLNKYGQVLQETPGTYLDGSQPVLLSFTTGWINLAGLQGFERFYQMFLLGKYLSPFKLNVSLAYDYNSSATQQTIVTPDNYTPAWGGEAVWGSGGPWGGPGNVFEARVFPQQQKCESFQVRIEEIYDPTYGNTGAAGLTLSGLNLIIGAKKGSRTSTAKRSFG